MTWLMPALLAPLVYAIVNSVDYYVLSTHIKDYKAVPTYIAVISLFAGIFFWGIAGAPVLVARDIGILLFTGALVLWSTVLYLKALTLEDTSKVIVMFQMFPLMSLVLSYVFLDEVITTKQLVGFVIVLASVVTLSLKDEGQLSLSNLSLANFSLSKLTLSKAFWLIFVFDLVWAATGILIKFSINQNSFMEILSYESFGIFIGGLVLYVFGKSFRVGFSQSLKILTPKVAGILVVNDLLMVFAKTLTFFAFSLGPVALVSILETTQVFWGILFGIVLTLWIPRSFSEDIKSSTLLFKGAVSIVLLLGIMLLY